ncbi:MAG TPA: acyl-CoA dehydrogenase [Pseudomonas xinjiangensis]|uniref:Acyl-CoA dehydrogenase n=2 Tax=root TaxID=1 RepID=A0A7V1BQZ2_9GAMM|nr:acyl-CoA dehydrogenase [Halopseudomonas xinjiangensis]HEC47384.1 acyl-CoA dehydrogenase [Halopseudomonas xinjiangensis]
MNFSLTDEQRMLVESAERYGRDKYTFEERRHIGSNPEGFSRQHWNQFAEMGWLALAIPESCGGLGGTATDIAMLMEPLGSALIIEPVVDTAILAASLIGASPDPAQREQWLGRIATGELIVALAHQEQASRNEYDFQVRTSATRTADGWSLSGQKHRVFHGAAASVLLVSAHLEGTADLGLFIVDSHSAGLSSEHYELIDGSRGADIRLNGVQVPATALLMNGGLTEQALEQALDQAILAGCSAAIGSMEAVMAMTADYLKTRVQYGKPLAQFQALQHRMAEMFVETDQSRAILHSALAAVESTDAGGRQAAISAAKYQISKAAYFVASQGIQLHGGIGTTEEYAVGHHYKMAVMFDQRFGDASFHLDRSSLGIDQLDQPLKGALYA